jgi:hypothetical protein
MVVTMPRAAFLVEQDVAAARAAGKAAGDLAHLQPIQIAVRARPSRDGGKRGVFRSGRSVMWPVNTSTIGMEYNAFGVWAGVVS